MKYKILLILLAITGLYSCQWGTGNAPKAKKPADTLAYSNQNFKKRASDCGDKPDSGCTIVKIKYPQFKSQKALNDSISHKLNKLFKGADKPDTSLDEVADNFLALYTNFRKERPLSTLFFLLDAHAKVLRQDSSLTTIEVAGYGYTGNPHGVSYTYFINWNNKANKNITLDDLFTDGYQSKLNPLAERIFRQNEKLKDTSSLNNQHDYFFKAGKFSLPDNYLITPTGIRFLYNVYTIKPYDAGPTELVLTYAQLKSILKPNTVLAQYNK